MFKFKKIDKTTVCERVIDQIKGSIAAGDLKPGDKLPSERTLTELFSVSRATVREALRALQYMGILKIRPNDGAYLNKDIDLISDQIKSSYTLKQFSFRELLEAREFLEEIIVALAAQRADAVQIAGLEDIYHKEIDDRYEINEFTSLDLSFHLTLALTCQNAFFREMIKPVLDLSRESCVRRYADRKQIDIALDYQRKIIEALKKGDPGRASAVTRGYLEGVVKTSLKIYDKETVK